MLQALLGRLQQLLTDAAPVAEAPVQETLEGIEERLPVHDPSTFVARVYRLLRQVRERPDDADLLREVEADVAMRLDRAAQVSARYEAASASGESRDVRYTMVRGFACYRDGLAAFQAFLEHGSEALAVEALRTVHCGDEWIARALELIGARQAEGLHVLL